MGGMSRAPAPPQTMQSSYQPAAMPQRPMMPMRQGGPMQSPSLYGPQQNGMASMIAALRGTAPQGQMNPGVQFMQNQANAPTTPMTSYENGQRMMQQMAQRQLAPIDPSRPKGIFGDGKGRPKGQAGPIPGFSVLKGQAGPIPQQSIGVAPRPSLSPSGMTFSPQRTQLPVAPPQPVAAPVVGKKRGKGTPQMY